MVKESDIEACLRRSATAAGGRCVKFIPDYARGWPDRLVLLPHGVTCWVELKTQCGRVSVSQEVAHEELRRLGQRVEIVRSKEEAEQLIELLTSK